jgi:hypothetical protein
VICLAEAVAFLDAAVLARPVTRTLLIRAAPFSGFRATWSALALQQADRHLGTGATPVSDLVVRFGWEMSPTATDADRFPRTSSTDRQSLADAVRAGAWYLVTEDVNDFDETELVGAGLSAVTGDLFLALRVSDAGYTETLDLMATGRLRTPRTAVELHAAIGRQHPRLARSKAHLFPRVEIMPPTHPEPRVIFRGSRCVRCAAIVNSDETILEGRCPRCRAAATTG